MATLRPWLEYPALELSCGINAWPSSALNGALSREKLEVTKKKKKKKDSKSSYIIHESATREQTQAGKKKSNNLFQVQFYKHERANEISWTLAHQEVFSLCFQITFIAKDKTSCKTPKSFFES